MRGHSRNCTYANLDTIAIAVANSVSNAVAHPHPDTLFFANSNTLRNTFAKRVAVARRYADANPDTNTFIDTQSVHYDDWNTIFERDSYSVGLAFPYADYIANSIEVADKFSDCDAVTECLSHRLTNTNAVLWCIAFIHCFPDTLTVPITVAE